MPLIMVTVVVGVAQVVAAPPLFKWIHRIIVTASGGFDTVPWNSFVVLMLTMSKLDHKRAYMPVFWVSLILPILISLLGVFFI